MRSTLTLLFTVVWLAAGLLWLLPRRRALVRKHGVPLSRQALNRLAAEDREAWNLHRDTWMLLAVGLVGGLAIVGSA